MYVSRAGTSVGFDGGLGLRNWQWLFLIEGIPSIVLGAAALLILTDRPDDAEWLSNEQRDWLVARLRHSAAATVDSHKLTALRALSHPTVWVLSATNLLMAMPLFAYAFWAPLFVRDAIQTSTIATGLVVAGIACAATVGMLVNSVCSDRTGQPRLHAGVGAVLAAIGCLGAACPFRFECFSRCDTLAPNSTRERARRFKRGRLSFICLVARRFCGSQSYLGRRYSAPEPTR